MGRSKTRAVVPVALSLLLALRQLGASKGIHLGRLRWSGSGESYPGSLAVSSIPKLRVLAGFGNGAVVGAGQARVEAARLKVDSLGWVVAGVEAADVKAVKVEVIAGE